MEKESNNQVLGEKNDTSRVYEVSYLLMPTISEEQVPANVSDIKNFLTSSGASIVSFEDPILIDLAYPMTKVVQTYRHTVEQGYFGWIKFEISGDSMNSINKFFDNNSLVLRYLIIKTVKENTLVNGKMKLKSEDKLKRVDSDEILDDVSFDESTEENDSVSTDDVDDKVSDDLVLA